MAIVPETRSGKIQFYQTHLPKWAEAPESIGVTPEAVATLQGLVDEAREAYAAHQRAQNAARSATLKFHQSVRRMHAGAGGGAHLLQMIKAFAATTDDPSVYTRAWIAAPASPGRPGSAPAPGTPYGFEVQLRQTGEMKLTWKCDNPVGTVGTIYHVRRQLDGEPTLRFIAAVGAQKSFTDDTLPAGTRKCTYEVTAVRSTRRGGSAEFTVRLGGAVRLPTIQPKTRHLAA